MHRAYHPSDDPSLGRPAAPGPRGGPGPRFPPPHAARRNPERAPIRPGRGGGGAPGAMERNRRLHRRPPWLGWLFARDLGRHWASPPVQQFVSEMSADVPGIGEVLDAIDKPVLILWGEGDRILPPSSVEYFRTHLRRGAVEVVPGSGHLPMVESSALVAARIARFLAEL